MDRINVTWQNWPGAPGVSTFYGTADLTRLDAISSFFGALVSLLPQNLLITVPSTGDSIDPGTGEITGTWSQAPTTPTRTGTNAGVYSGATGAVVHWLTGGVRNGRRVRGRTFLVPLVSGAFDGQGSLGTSRTTIQTAADGLVAAVGGGLSVWARPTTFQAGNTYTITSTRVPDLAVVLRSRRI